jgi:hypothetical protein
MLNPQGIKIFVTLPKIHKHSMNKKDVLLPSSRFQHLSHAQQRVPFKIENIFPDGQNSEPDPATGSQFQQPAPGDPWHQ